MALHNALKYHVIISKQSKSYFNRKPPPQETKPRDRQGGVVLLNQSFSFGIIKAKQTMSNCQHVTIHRQSKPVLPFTHIRSRPPGGGIGFGVALSNSCGIFQQSAPLCKLMVSSPPVGCHSCRHMLGWSCARCATGFSGAQEFWPWPKSRSR